MTLYIILDLCPHKRSESIELVARSMEEVKQRLESLKEQQGKYWDEDRYMINTWNI